MSAADIEQEKAQYQEQVRFAPSRKYAIADQQTTQLDLVISQLRDDPDNVELSSLKDELTDVLNILNESLAELQPKNPAVKQPTPPKEPEKWSRENHPALKKSAPAADIKEDGPVNYQVNDTVMAKWLSGDRGYYPARITSITGSSAAPIYVVKFKSYDETETLSIRDIRPVSNKRKAEAPPPPPTAAPPLPGVVSSAGATVYPEVKKLQEQAEDPAKPPKPKKIKAKKELEAGKSKWQEFNSKSKFGKTKKDSMFRTPEGVHGRGE